MEIKPIHSEFKSTRSGVAAIVLPELWRSLNLEERAIAFAEVPGRLGADSVDPTIEPLESLVRMGPQAGISVAPCRMRLADAVWLARESSPVVAWSERGGEWVVIVRHGFFRPRTRWISAGGMSEQVLSRRELAARLGVAGPESEIDVGIVTPFFDPVSASESDSNHHGNTHPSPLQRLAWLLKPEKQELWSIVVFSAITGILYLALPLAINAFISNLSFGTRSGPFLQGLFAIAVVLLLCLAIAAILRVLQHVVAEVIQRRIFVRIGSDLARRLPLIDTESTDGTNVPELVNRFLDVVTLQKSGSMLLLTGINLVLGAVIGLGILAFYHPFLLGFAAAILVAITFIVFVIGRGAVRTSVEESRSKYAVVEWFEELARHPRLFKHADGAEFAASRADELMRSYLAARSDHFRILLRQISSLVALEVAAGSMLLAVGGWLVLDKQLTLGQLVASEIIVSMIVASISKLGKQFEAWYDAVAAIDKLGYLVDLRTERLGGESITPVGKGARVDVRGISHSQPGGKKSFEDISFSVEPGERVAILASRGMGSSAMLEMMFGLRRPSAGEVVIDSLPVGSWDLAQLRSQVLMLRSGDIMSGTIAENIRLGRFDVGPMDIQRAVEASGLADSIRELPYGLATPLVSGGFPLTGRQCTRLLAARALAIRPRLLLIDELFEGHQSTLDELARVLIEAPHPWTVIVVTHDPRVAARCGRTIEFSPSVSSHA
jgi:ABC-type bacteriocin/lantibiotic exporter with double-glycine peptidase domain